MIITRPTRAMDGLTDLEVKARLCAYMADAHWQEHGGSLTDEDRGSIALDAGIAAGRLHPHCMSPHCKHFRSERARLADMAGS